MIFSALLNIVVFMLGVLFSWTEPVNTLPTINDFDIDGALVTGVSQFKAFTVTFWPFWYLFVAFNSLLGYYALKMLLKFFLGHRAPGSH